MKTLTMVARVGLGIKSDKSLVYLLIGEDYSFLKLKGTELINGIMENKYSVSNIDLIGGKLVGTNGTLDRYTLISEITGKCSKQAPVIINRVETDKGLVGYTIFNTKGVMQEVKVDKAVEMHSVTPFANGKIRKTQNGDIISSINGTYPLKVIENTATDTGKLKIYIVNVVVVTADGVNKSKYASLIINADNASAIGNIYNKLKESNEKITKYTYDLCQDSNIEKTFKMKRTENGGICGAFPIEVLYELAKQQNELFVLRKTLAVGCMDYSNMGKPKKSAVVLGTKLNVMYTKITTETGKIQLKQFNNEFISNLAGINIRSAA